MESFLPMVLEACPGLPVIDASKGIDLLEEEDEEEHEHGGHNHEEEENSHIWLDPARASAMAENLAEGLVGILPEHETEIRANLASLQSRLSVLESAMKTSVSGLPARDVIIMHEAFLNVIEIVDTEPEDNLPASRLVQLIKTVSGCSPLPLVIRSTEEDPAVSVLAAETGVPVCALDTLASGPDNPPLDYYEQIMLKNLEEIKNALLN